MERRRIRKEEEREKEKKKKELKKAFRKKEKTRTRTGLSSISATKLIIIISLIVTPIVIFFVYNYFVSEKQPQYSFLTEGDEVYGTLINDSEINSTHIITNIAIASTAEFLSLEIVDNYPYDPSYYFAPTNPPSVFTSVYAIPYNLHTNNHDEVDDRYIEFMLAFLHNVPDMLMVLRRSGSVIYPSVLQWNYRLNGTDLDTLNSSQEKYFFDPVITVEPGVRTLTKDQAHEIRVTVNLTAGYSHNIGFSEITMTFKNTPNITFSDPKVWVGGVRSKPDQITFTSRKRKISPINSMLLKFNITMNATQNFPTENILALGNIFFQFGAKLLQNIYPTRDFNSLKTNILGIPDEKQLEAFIYMIRIKYTNYKIDFPLLFSCP